MPNKQMFDGNKQGAVISVGTFILVFVTILVGLAFLPAIIASIDNVSGDVTGATAVILGLVPLFYVLLILAVAAVEVLVAFKKAG